MEIQLVEYKIVGFPKTIERVSSAESLMIRMFPAVARCIASEIHIIRFN